MNCSMCGAAMAFPPYGCQNCGNGAPVTHGTGYMPAGTEKALRRDRLIGIAIKTITGAAVFIVGTRIAALMLHIKTWELFFLIFYLTLHVYLTFGFIYAGMVDKSTGWNPWPRAKLSFWWIPTFLRRRREKIVKRVLDRLMGVPRPDTMINRKIYSFNVGWMKIKRMYVRKRA